MSNIPSKRHLFDIPDDIAYFNCAYNSPELKEGDEQAAFRCPHEEPPMG